MTVTLAVRAGRCDGSPELFTRAKSAQFNGHRKRWENKRRVKGG
jgi:hypothetical protein